MESAAPPSLPVPCDGAPSNADCRHLDAELDTLFPARDYISGQRFRVVRCRRCGLTRTHPSPPKHALHAYYPQTYYGATRRFIRPIDWLLDRVNRRKARAIARAYGGVPEAVLEIGCGHGLLLEQLRRLGARVTGTEMSAASSAYAREVLRLDVRIGDLAALRLPSEGYDVVLLWHVLEHLNDPSAYLREVARVMRPGGLAVIGVPNVASAEARWGKDAWFHLDVPRHVTHFTPTTLRTIIDHAGLRVDRLRYYSPEHDYFSFVQTVLNRLGLPFNQLYHLVRRDAAQIIEGGRGRSRPGTLVANVVLTPILSVVSLLWVPAAAVTRRGSAMVAYARKRDA